MSEEYQKFDELRAAADAVVNLWKMFGTYEDADLFQVDLFTAIRSLACSAGHDLSNGSSDESEEKQNRDEFLFLRKRDFENGEGQIACIRQASASTIGWMLTEFFGKDDET